MSSVGRELERYLLRELLQGSAIDSIAVDEDLLGSGIIDSHGLMQLVTFLRTNYGVAVADDQLKPENFQSIQSIEAFVLRERR